MWVIREEDGKFQLGYFVNNYYARFEVYETYDDKYSAEKQCHYLNGGN